MAKQLTDEEVALRRKLRRRLIGAAALTLTLVVTVPMVLDSEPKATGDDIELRIPAADKVGEFVPGKATEEVYDTPVASSVESAVPAASAVPQAAPALPASLPIIRAVSAPTAVQPSTSAPAKAHEAAKAAPRQAAPDTAANSAGYVAQVGAYGNADTAKHELAQLKAWGFKAYTEKVGDTTRVRVGPYAERDKAEKVRHLLERHGLHPVVTSAK